MGLFIFMFFLITPSFGSHEGPEERLYEKMTDFNVAAATENLLIALETSPDGEKYIWKHGSYKGYVIPTTTFLNEEGYFCRNYVEVLIRRTEYNMYENLACRDHDGEWVWIETTTAYQAQGNKRNKH